MMKKYIGLTVIVLVVILGAFLVLKGKKANAPTDTTNIEIKDNFNIAVETSDESFATPSASTKPSEKSSSNNTQISLTKEQAELLAKLQTAVDARDFESFAQALEQVYKNQWGGMKEFVAPESNMYVYATNTYWAREDLVNSLKVSTLVYNKAPEGWRFRYLRIVTLEKYGRNALNKKDLKTAENYANQILQMSFRPEGANLLADIYIQKIQADIMDNNRTQATADYDYIKDYEVSTDRKTLLDGLKAQIDKLQ